MQLTRRESVFVFLCSYDERDTPKSAGFAWSGHTWWTDHVEVARRLQEYADDAALASLNEVEAFAPQILLPEGKRVGGQVADVRTREKNGLSFIEVHYPGKNDALMTALKDVGFRWAETRCWQRTMSIRAGDPIDRVAEVGCLLLEACFHIRVHHAEAQRRVVSGDFTPEQSRWIGFEAPDNEPLEAFKLTWRRSDDLYAAAKSLPGARYRGHGAVFVPKDSFEAVLDFAGRYLFELTAGAQAAVATQRAQIISSIVVTRRPKTPTPAAPTSKPSAIAVSSAEESIDADLLDA